MKSFNVKAFRIIVFFVISLASSVLFRYDVFGVYKEWSLPSFLNIFKSLLEGIGPFVGALLVVKVFKIKSEITFKGVLGAKSWLMLGVPVFILSLLGVSYDEYNSHLYGFLLGLWIMVYGILEETGWRGYLQNELKDLKPLVKYSVVGIFWYIWHLTFLGNTTLINEVFVAAILILSSWGIGYVTDKTKSIFAAACFHIIGNILGLSSLFAEEVAMNSRLIVVTTCSVI